jgi:hypothetical protein
VNPGKSCCTPTAETPAAVLKEALLNVAEETGIGRKDGGEPEIAPDADAGHVALAERAAGPFAAPADATLDSGPPARRALESGWTASLVIPGGGGTAPTAKTPAAVPEEALPAAEGGAEVGRKVEGEPGVTPGAATGRAALAEGAAGAFADPSDAAPDSGPPARRALVGGETAALVSPGGGGNTLAAETPAAVPEEALPAATRVMTVGRKDGEGPGVAPDADAGRVAARRALESGGTASLVSPGGGGNALAAEAPAAVPEKALPAAAGGTAVERKDTGEPGVTPGAAAGRVAVAEGAAGASADPAGAAPDSDPPAKRALENERTASLVSHGGGGNTLAAEAPAAGPEEALPATAGGVMVERKDGGEPGVAPDAAAGRVSTVKRADDAVTDPAAAAPDDDPPTQRAPVRGGTASLVSPGGVGNAPAAKAPATDPEEALPATAGGVRVKRKDGGKLGVAPDTGRASMSEGAACAIAEPAATPTRGALVSGGAATLVDPDDGCKASAETPASVSSLCAVSAGAGNERVRRALSSSDRPGTSVSRPALCPPWPGLLCVRICL